MSGLSALAETVVACRRCPRLVRYHGTIQADEPSWHCKPVPGFGDPRAKLLLVGLAPSRTGGNRTGRIFTGDKTGEVLFRSLHRAGLSSAPRSARRPTTPACARARCAFRRRPSFTGPCIACRESRG